MMLARDAQSQCGEITRRGGDCGKVDCGKLSYCLRGERRVKLRVGAAWLSLSEEGLSGHSLGLELHRLRSV